jgi:hypothetical protein
MLLLIASGRECKSGEIIACDRDRCSVFRHKSFGLGYDRKGGQEESEKDKQHIHTTNLRREQYHVPSQHTKLLKTALLTPDPETGNGAGITSDMAICQ